MPVHITPFLWMKTSFSRCVERIQADALYETPSIVTWGDQLLLLSTCDQNDAESRILIACYREKQDLWHYRKGVYIWIRMNWLRKLQAIQVWQKDVGIVINTFIVTVTKALVEGSKVQLLGFGVFGTRERNARKVRNPRTGESIDLAASTVPYFKPGKILRDVVKSINHPI